MSADRQEEQVRDAASGMARGGEEMEHELSRLEGHIDEAKSAATQRQDAPQQRRSAGEGGDVAGDWEGESSGSQQGEDPTDTEGEQRGADASGEAEPAG